MLNFLHDLENDECYKALTSEIEGDEIDLKSMNGKRKLKILGLFQIRKGKSFKSLQYQDIRKVSNNESLNVFPQSLHRLTVLVR
jgi:hypothetical protein